MPGAHHRVASVALWRAHYEAGIGVLTPIPYYRTHHNIQLFSVAWIVTMTGRFEMLFLGLNEFKHGPLTHDRWPSS